MAEAGWGHGRPVETDTGIVPVLHAYITQGGQLLGARRWPDNPLTLTHVRWQGPGSGPLEAVRRPSSEDTLPAGEREVWVQLALAFPPAYSIAAGGDAAWSPLAVDRDRAFTWLQKIRQEQRPRQPSGWSPPYGSGSAPGPRIVDAAGYGGQRPLDHGISGRPSAPQPPHASDSFAGRPMSPPFGGRHPVPSGPPSFMSSTPTVVEPAVSPPRTPPHQTVPPFRTPPRSTPSPAFDEPMQQSGAWQRSAMESPEVAVVTCVEVELPPMLGGPAADDYRRDFARDVALHFSRAARTIPQAREVRGWMRGERLVLATRCVVAMGHRPPTQAEMSGVAQLLAGALAQRTLPFAQLGFADPGEWLHGAPLPE